MKFIHDSFVDGFWLLEKTVELEMATDAVLIPTFDLQQVSNIHTVSIVCA
jgi:hypothetical protein